MRFFYYFSCLLQNGFDPKEENATNDKSFKRSPQNTKHEKGNPASLWSQNCSLYRRVPVLGVLCAEVIVCQSLSAVVTFLFFRHVRQNIDNDQERAGWTGNVSTETRSFLSPDLAAIYVRITAFLKYEFVTHLFDY